VAKWLGSIGLGRVAAKIPLWGPRKVVKRMRDKLHKVFVPPYNDKFTIELVFLF
jgi:hypothetical protein